MLTGPLAVWPQVFHERYEQSRGLLYSQAKQFFRHTSAKPPRPDSFLRLFSNVKKSPFGSAPAGVDCPGTVPDSPLDPTSPHCYPDTQNTSSISSPLFTIPNSKWT